MEDECWVIFPNSSRLSTDSRRCRLSTDTLPILDRLFPDTLPTRWYHDRPSVDLSTDLDRQANTTRLLYRPTLDRHIDRYVDRQLTEISADTVIDSPRKIHDPINLLWESLLSRLECLAICRDKMYAAFMITIERTLGVGLDGKWTWDCHSNVFLFWKTATRGIYQMW